MQSLAPSTPGLGACAVFSLRRAARLVTRLYEEEMRGAGLTASQFTILSALSQKGAINQSRLAALLGVERTTLTRDLRPLAVRGLISVGGDRADARVKRISLTESGEQTYQAALPLWRNAQATAFDLLGPGDWPAVLKHLATRFEPRTE